MRIHLRLLEVQLSLNWPIFSGFISLVSHPSSSWTWTQTNWSLDIILTIPNMDLTLSPLNSLVFEEAIIKSSSILTSFEVNLNSCKHQKWLPFTPLVAYLPWQYVLLTLTSSLSFFQVIICYALKNIIIFKFQGFLNHTITCVTPSKNEWPINGVTCFRLLATKCGTIICPKWAYYSIVHGSVLPWSATIFSWLIYYIKL